MTDRTKHASVKGKNVSAVSGSVPFPTIADSILHEFGIEALRLRPFGTEPADLDIDFGDRDSYRLEIMVIARCGLVIPAKAGIQDAGMHAAGRHSERSEESAFRTPARGPPPVKQTQVSNNV